jgi:protein-disulfide isomerase
MRKLALFGTLVLFAAGAGAQALPPVAQILSERILGKADAPVTVIEYASFTCPHCANFHNKQFPAIEKEYIATGKARLIFREYPTAPRALSLAASMMARCAPRSRYFAIVKMLFRTQEKWATAADPTKALAGIGWLAGMSQATFDACLNNEPVYRGILGRALEGERKDKVEGTPTFLVNGRKIRSGLSLDEFRKVLDAAAGGK